MLPLPICLLSRLGTKKWRKSKIFLLFVARKEGLFWTIRNRLTGPWYISKVDIHTSNGAETLMMTVSDWHSRYYCARTVCQSPFFHLSESQITYMYLLTWSPDCFQISVLLPSRISSGQLDYHAWWGLLLSSWRNKKNQVWKVQSGFDWGKLTITSLAKQNGRATHKVFSLVIPLRHVTCNAIVRFNN